MGLGGLTCRDEDSKFRDSKVAQQRAEALQRAEQRAAEEQVKAKEAQRAAFMAQRWSLPSSLEPYCLH